MRKIFFVLFLSLCSAFPAVSNGGSLVSGEPADYCIIAPSAWRSALDYYVSKKTAEGYYPRVFSVEDIYANYAGQDQREKIRNFIKDAFTVWGISYVLLVGDHTYIPAGPVASGLVSEQDNYYVLLDGDADRYQDVYIGRLPAENISQVSAVLRRWADYQTHGWGRTEFCLTGTDQPLASSNDFALYRWEINDAWGGHLFRTIQPQDIFNAMNSGYGLVNWTGHGSEQSWIVKLLAYAGDTGFAYSYQDANAMNNGNKLSFINAFISCLTGKFATSKSIAKTFLLAPSGGAIGYIGANREVMAPSVDSMCQLAFYEDIKEQFLSSGYCMPGVAFHHAVAGKSSVLTYNLLGDPTAKMDLLPLLPDTVSPQAGDVRWSNNIPYPGQQTVLSARIEDNDCVGIPEVNIMSPDGDHLEKKMNFNKVNNRYESYVWFTDIAQVGTYHVQIIAKDISQNEAIVSAPDLTVIADTKAPQITSFTCTPQPAYKGGTVNFQAVVTDNSGDFGITAWVEITKPGGERLTINPLPSYYLFTDTGKTGTYTVVVYAEDFSKNQAAPYHTAFEILDDTHPPAILDCGVTDRLSSESDIAKITFISPPGTGVTVYEIVSDDISQGPDLKAWAEITKPDSTMATYSLWWAGMSFPQGFSVSFSETQQTGAYSIVYYVQDKAGNVTRSSPLRFEVRGNNPPLGDVSGNKEITVYDAALAVQHAVGLITLTSEQITRGDVSGGGGVSAYDAALIAQYAVGLITKFPVGG